MMDIEVTIRANSKEDLQKKLRMLSEETDGTGVLPYQLRRSIRLAKRDVDAILDDWCEIVAGGNYMRRSELIQKHANETMLYDAPIDTWWAIVEDAEKQIRAAERAKATNAFFEEMSK